MLNTRLPVAEHPDHHHLEWWVPSGERGLVYRNGELIGKRGFGSHVFDANDVCVYCRHCVDRSCCDISDQCPYTPS